MIGIPEDMVIIGLLVVTMKVISGKAVIQGDQGDQNSTGNSR